MISISLNPLKFLSEEWRNFAEGNTSIESVLTAYDRHGFDANQDLPGNVLWEEMYRASVEFKINIAIKIMGHNFIDHKLYILEL